VVRLEDQFNPQETIVDISKVKQFCTAVSKDGSVIQDPAAHLTCYKMKRPKRKTKIQVISTPDQLDQLELDVRKRKRGQLCVPSQLVQQQGTPTATPTPWAPSLDHFELYRIKRTKGAPKFVTETVELDDQFLDETTMELKKPVQFGVPTNKNREGIGNPSRHLTCYSVRAPKFENQEVTVTNQFKEEQRLSVRRPYRLCVPSYKQVVTFD
jgi:hypothetical protein